MRQTKAYEKIIFPLDFGSAKEAIEYVHLLKDKVGLFKVGLELFISEGPSIVQDVTRISGRPVFLDMKLHDIPETVSRAITAASKLGIGFLTFHPEEGGNLKERLSREILKTTKLLGITLLTSSESPKDSPLYRNLSAEEICLFRAQLALENGAAGVVCSPFEAKAIKKHLPLLVITPGIRPAWAGVGNDDQKRSASPGEAVRMGADYIVVGRPIRDADKPGEAASLVAEEIEQELRSKG